MRHTYATLSDFSREKKDRVATIKKENRQDEIRLIASLLVNPNKDFFLSITDTLKDSIEHINKAYDDLTIPSELFEERDMVDEMTKEEYMQMCEEHAVDYGEPYGAWK